MANKINPGTSHEEDPGSFFNEQEKLCWLLQINEELFSKELAKIVSILTSLSPSTQFLKSIIGLQNIWYSHSGKYGQSFTTFLPST